MKEINLKQKSEIIWKWFYKIYNAEELQTLLSKCIHEIWCNYCFKSLALAINGFTKLKLVLITPLTNTKLDLLLDALHKNMGLIKRSFGSWCSLHFY